MCRHANFQLIKTEQQLSPATLQVPMRSVVAMETRSIVMAVIFQKQLNLPTKRYVLSIISTFSMVPKRVVQIVIHLTILFC